MSHPGFFRRGVGSNAPVRYVRGALMSANRRKPICSTFETSEVMAASIEVKSNARIESFDLNSKRGIRLH